MERLIGDAAKNQAAMNPKNTIFDAKRLIGRRFDDPEVKADMKHWPFIVVDKEGNPFIQVEYQGETKTYSPQGKHTLLWQSVVQAKEKKKLVTTRNLGSHKPKCYRDHSRLTHLFHPLPPSSTRDK